MWVRIPPVFARALLLSGRAISFSYDLSQQDLHLKKFEVWRECLQDYIWMPGVRFPSWETSHGYVLLPLSRSFD